jgi:multiple sugar transport system permease protein
LVYPRVRDFTRKNPEYPELNGLQEFMDVGVGHSRLVVLVGDAVFVRSLINTIVFTLVIVPVQGGLALLLALLINSRMRGVNVFRTIYFIPVVMSMVVVSLLWRFIYSPQGGLLNGIIGTITFGAVRPVDWLGDSALALPAVMLMSMWQAVGFQMVIWLAGLQLIPTHLYEAAALDGAGRWAQFKDLTWPGLHNTAVFVFITITIAAFGLFTQIDVMTRGGPLDATSTVIFQAVEQGFRKQDLAYGSAISVVFFVLVLTVALIQRRLTRDRG